MLGDKLEQIASEKAGIIKTGKPVVVGWLKQMAREVVIERAAKLNSPIHLLDEEQEAGFPKLTWQGHFSAEMPPLLKKRCNCSALPFRWINLLLKRRCKM